MNEDLIADLWHVCVEHIPMDKRDDVAAEFVNVLVEFDVKEETLSSLKGVDPNLDNAVEYALDEPGEYFD